MRLGQDEEAIKRADEALAIAEPRRLDRIVADAFVNKGSALGGMGRMTESVVLTRAAVELAARTGDTSLELRARNNHATMLSADDNTASQEALREALELATRVGNQQMAQWLAGTFAYGCIYEGTDWDAGLAVLDGALERSRSDADRARLLWLREVIMTWRGEDTSAIDAERRIVFESVSDPDFEAWSHMLPALEAMLAGRPGDAIAGYRRAIPLAVQQVSDARVGLIRASHWALDLEAARDGLREAEAETFGGRYIDAERALGRAGVAALEGRKEDALAAFRESVEHSRLQRGGFDAAMAQLSALILLPDEPTIASWADEARACFEAVKSPPLLARVDEAAAARVA
jgi:tetratricopeptide (TPR) repeat protein